LVTENLTVHRLLGSNLYHHPGTTILDFNKIAPTLMQKALQSILEKEARSSKRAQIPGPAVLDRISEIGDIRSAISSLEFLCLKGDGAGKWGGSLATKTKKSTRGQVALTPMEQESLKTISQRESSLGMFHAVGKIVYNKREDKSLLQDPTVALPPPPDHLRHYRRDKVSQVSVNELIDETGTDISTFICALHENYPPSCEGHSFTDSINDCIEALSDSDLLSIDRRSVHGARAGVGTGATGFSGGIDLLRQDEIGFQVATRGLLFALPYPVNRKLAPGNGRTRPGDAHKMFYPASLRLWREAEEVQGLMDSWMKRFLHPSGGPHLSPVSDVPSSGVKSWSSRIGQHGHLGSASVGRATVTTMLSRHDALLYQLPYMAQIQRQDSERRQLERITTFRATARENTWDDDALDDLNDRSLLPGKHSSSWTEAPMAPTDEEEKLILSDDDIMD
jgi:cell cycle checkpoint protein